MERTPISLLERLKRPDDPIAWDRFVQLYTPLLYHWASRFGLQPSDARDLVQDIFVVLVQKLPAFRYDPKRRFRGWLWTLTVNRYREQCRRRTIPLEQDGGAALDELPASDPVAAFDEAEYRHYLMQRALELMRTEFQPTTWQAFWECATKDRPAAEVAAELGLSVDAVYAAKSRVLRRLRRELDGLLE